MYTPTDKKLYNSISNKVKATVKRWPSAYASGQVVQQYKRAFATKYGPRKKPYIEPKTKKQNLNRWFKEKWVDVCRPKVNGQYQNCGRLQTKGKYPFCRPLIKVSKHTPMTVSEVISKYGPKKLKERCKLKQQFTKKTLSNL